MVLVTTDDDDSVLQLDIEPALGDGNQDDLSHGGLFSWFRARMVAFAGLLLLPSFIRDLVEAKLALQTSCEAHHYEIVGRRRRDTEFLDAMRGIAALCVFFEHFLLPFWGNIFYSYGGHKDTSIFQLPIVRLLYSGSPMVCIFLVISGTAFSLKLARLMEKGDWDLLYRTIESMILRRGIRLLVPSLLVSFTLMLMAHMHLCDIQSAVPYEGPPELLEEFWMKQPQFLPSIWHQVREWSDFTVAKVLIPSTWRGTTTGRDYGDLEHVEYGSQLWTVAVEYWSSILLFATLLGTARLRPAWRLSLFAVLFAFSFWISRWDFALFLYGSILASTPAFQMKMLPSTRTIPSTCFCISLLLFGLHLASFPELGGANTPGFAWLCLVSSNSRFWQSIGAALTVATVGNIKAVRRILSCSLLLYFGRISYALYLVHIPLLLTLGWRLVPKIWELTGRQTNVEECAGLAVSFFILLCLLVWMADLICRFVDEPCVLFARRFNVGGVMNKLTQLIGMAAIFPTLGYRRTNQHSYDDESLLDEDGLANGVSEKKTLLGSTWPQSSWLRYMLYMLLLVLYSFALVTYVPRRCSDTECGKQVSIWSPMNEAIEYFESDLNTEFDHQTQYRGPPTPELETAWDKLWRFDPVPFPANKLPLVNRSGGMLNDEKLARLGDGGKEAPVAANFEVFHQLHCLNYIRQYTWRDWYFRHPDKVIIPLDMLASDVSARMHADHCIDHLRTSLMCHGDTTPFFTIIDPSQPLGARGDFSAHHKCRDFERNQSWTKENSEKFHAFKEDVE
ncbi:hypothetical protein NM208_g10061 [Fusarium decemcellulare]|uniref:Uncharacterized protein n=1 Tax=Fusarium decemcellulare TaxID=57161 RepID=A0ACC1RZ83_9HYPO|nr:hypothetical protein NM208_g10061 [Fusarium decemcellulare]